MEAPEGEQFNELIQEWVDNELKKLANSSDPIELYRAQGALKYLSQIVELPATIRTYQHEVAIGKRKKIEEEAPHGLVR